MTKNVDKAIEYNALIG